MPADLPSSLTSESTAVRCGTMTYLIFVTCAVRSKNIKKGPKIVFFFFKNSPPYPHCHTILGVKFSSLKMCRCKNIRYVQRGSEVRTSHNCTIEQLHIVCHVQGFSRPVQKRKECPLKNLMQRMHTVCRMSGFVRFCWVLPGFVRFCRVMVMVRRFSAKFSPLVCHPAFARASCSCWWNLHLRKLFLQIYIFGGDFPAHELRTKSDQ